MYDKIMKMNKNTKFVKGFPDSFEDESLFLPEQTHVVILDDIIQASTHPEKYECHDVDAKSISTGKIQLYKQPNQQLILF